MIGLVCREGGDDRDEGDVVNEEEEDYDRVEEDVVDEE